MSDLVVRYDRGSRYFMEGLCRYRLFGTANLLPARMQAIFALT